MHNRFWRKFLDLLLLMKGKFVDRTRCLDRRLGQQYYVFFLFPDGLSIF
jgi:hypothetical protein